MRSKSIIAYMEKRGYTYDNIDSCRGYIRFFYEGGVISFTTWKEVDEWARECL